MAQLEEALSDFARTRSSQLTAHIVELGEVAARTFEAPKERKNTDFHAAWTAAVKLGPAAMTWAMKSLLAQLPKHGGGFGEPSDALVDRLRTLEALPPDPRVSKALVELAELNPPIAGFVDVMIGIAKALVKHADDATEAAIPPDFLFEELDEGFDPKQLRFPQRVEHGSPAPARKAPEDEAAWRAVYAAPNDDAPREVLADLLQERGDPRGEFIALQLREARGDASAEERARAAALIKEHGKRWLGALRPAVYRAEMRRGFLWRVELAGSWATSKWAAHASDPSLATVQELWHGQATSKVLAPFLRSSATANLVAAPAGDVTLLEALSSTEKPRLETLGVSLDGKTMPALFAYLEKNERIIGLVTNRSVGASVKKWPEFLRRRLRRLSCSDSMGKASALRASLPALEQLTLEHWPRVTLFRDPTLARVEAHGASLGAEVKGLPKSVRHIEFEGSRAYFERLAKARPSIRFTHVVRSGAIINPKG